MTATVTLDVLSALTDSHRGATAHLAGLDGVDDPAGLARDWDARTKELHRTTRTWCPHADLAARALADAYTARRVERDPAADAAGLLGSLVDWPLWLDAAALPAAAWEGLRVGLLTNCDDDLLATTRAAALPWVDRGLLVTSESLRAYKPDPVFYDRAGERLGPFVHVAASARDVRGAVEAGVACVRLARPGHRLDPEGPAPALTVTDAADVPDAVRRLLAR
ncbi:hypothetical protein GCM10027047_05140 [Rhodococcus aerolatus]